MGRRDGKGGGRRERREEGKVADEEGGRAFKEQRKMPRPDRQLGSLFRLRLQPTSDDTCENKTLCGYTRRMHLYLILYQKMKKEKKIEDGDISGFL